MAPHWHFLLLLLLFLRSSRDTQKHVRGELVLLTEFGLPCGVHFTTAVFGGEERIFDVRVCSFK